MSPRRLKGCYWKVRTGSGNRIQLKMYNLHNRTCARSGKQIVPEIIEGQRLGSTTASGSSRREEAHSALGNGGAVAKK
jgi:hypothetical protein